MLPTRRAILSVRQRLPILNQRLDSRPLSVSRQHLAKKKPTGDGEGPIPFSSSKAATWSMTNSVMVPKRDVPWYQPLSISFSILVFMLYFLFLREENDLDVELNYSLFERVPQLEEHQVKLALEYGRQQGKDTSELEKRLAEIRRNKQMQKEQS
ncbi:uncharacterized protein LOC143292677 [Babylonia areolata]|uniref:uncharacterized protein LOC143292677 n=1 Tax=Babylonia areolata TaxID=304850 RepID=UPI003FCF301E